MKNVTCEVRVNPCYGWIYAKADWRTTTVLVKGKLVKSRGKMKAQDGENVVVLPKGETAIRITGMKSTRVQVRESYGTPKYGPGVDGVIDALVGKTLMVRNLDQSPIATEIWI